MPASSLPAPFRLAGLALLAGLGPLAPAQIFSVEHVSGLGRPLYVTAPPGDPDRIFVLEQRTGSPQVGRVRVVRNTTNASGQTVGQLVSTPFLTLTGISTGSEQGLLGLAFDPQFATNRRVFLSFTNGSGASVIRRVQAQASNPELLDATVPAVDVLTFSRTNSNHNAGWIGFGPDGLLYIPTGDSGGGGDPGNAAVNLSDRRGKILRLDVSGAGYTVPAGNPYAALGGVQAEILAFGLRNPWRVSFDRETGDLWIGDVGQNTREEISFVPAPQAWPVNFGWDRWEGFYLHDGSTSYPAPAPAARLTFPLHDYPRSSVTGGYVYRGQDNPGLRGAYLFADYLSGAIQALRHPSRAEGPTASGTTTSAPAEPIPTVTDLTGLLLPASGTTGNVSSFGEDAGGELYWVDYGGRVFRVASPFGEWRRREYTAAERLQPAVSGAFAPANGSGLPNALVYAFGGSRTDATSNLLLPVVRLFTTGSPAQTYLALDFARVLTASDIEYVVEFADSPGAVLWTEVARFTGDGVAEGAGFVSESSTADPNETRILVRDTVTSGPGSSRYGRVRVVFRPIP